MPSTEAQKRAMKKWREKNRQYFVEYRKTHVEDLRRNNKIASLKRTIAHKQELLETIEHKQELLATYISSRSKDSPITTDEESPTTTDEDST